VGSGADHPAAGRAIEACLHWAAPDELHALSRPGEERRWLDAPYVLRRTLAEFGFSGAPEQVETIRSGLYSVPLRHFNVALFPDAATTVDRLHLAGFRLAIVTARPWSEALVRRELHDQGLPDVFEVVVTSGEVGQRKSDSAVLRVAVDRLGIPPERAVVVGDSYEEDVLPAVQIGAVAVLKGTDRSPDPRQPLARLRITSLADLLDLDLFTT
jgi:FMN phosphatase YigB (HAD superfamily)